MVETTKVQATVPDRSIEWLREMYPDAKSDSERMAMAISDARKLHKLLEARRVTEIAIDE